MGMFAQTGSNKKSGSAGAGSEDFAYVSQQVPSIMLALAAGTAVYVYDAMRWLEEH